jgi:hypothetical protein
MRVLVFEMHVPVKWHTMSDYQTMDAMWLQEVFEVASIHMQADPVHHTAFFQTHLNTLVLTSLTAS